MDKREREERRQTDRQREREINRERDKQREKYIRRAAHRDHSRVAHSVGAASSDHSQGLGVNALHKGLVGRTLLAGFSTPAPHPKTSRKERGRR